MKLFSNSISVGLIFSNGVSFTSNIFVSQEIYSTNGWKRRVTSAAKDHRVGRKSKQRKRPIVYEQVMSRAPCIHQTLMVHFITEYIAILCKTAHGY